jgi:uncharacterized protein YqeY
MILESLKSKLTESIKARDTQRVSLLRLLISAINNKEIALRSQSIEMKDKHVLKAIQKEIKQRKDSIEAYKQGQRDDLVDKETTELNMLEEIYKEFSGDEDQ